MKLRFNLKEVDEEPETIRTIEVPPNDQKQTVTIKTNVSVTKKPSYPHQRFETVNWIAAGGHLLNAVLTFFIGDTKQYTIYDPYASWAPFVGNCPADYYTIDRGNRTWLVNPRAQHPSMTISLFWLIFMFHLLSAVFQGYAGCARKTYVRNIVERGVNPLRFVEYSLSATIMLICIALVSGVDDYHGILAVELLTFVTMILGLIGELMFDDGIADYRLKQIGWLAHFTGWVTMLGAYVGVILKKYFFSIEMSDQGPPEWVTIVIFAVFALYNIFGITQFIQLCCKYPVQRCCMGKNVQKNDRKVCGTSINVFIEMMYVANSLVTKTLLGWMIIANLAIEDTAEYTKCKPQYMASLSKSN